MTNITMNPSGEIALPPDVRARRGFTPQTPIRVIETRSGVLLVPLTEEPMDPVLAQELADWQALSATTWDMFPYHDDQQ
jgi:hypothetical protein